MFNRLYGTISSKDEQLLLLRQNGIEWEIHTTSTSISQFPPAESETSVYTYVYHKEDQLSLYGFAAESERSLFLELIKISGIGPKQACKILSGISDTQFIQALDNEDVNVLTRLPGLGKKTAQKIILSLRGKLTTGEREQEAFADIVEALYNMGFDKGEAKQTVRDLAKRHDQAELSKEELEQKIMKDAIVELSQ